MNTSEKGALTESKAVEYFVKENFTVFLPFSDTCSIDLICVKGVQLTRIQCKTGRISKNRETIDFNARSCNKQLIKDYHGKIDFFFVYVTELDKKYLIPIDKVGKNSMSLRLVPTKRKKKNTNFALDFEVK